MADRFKTMAIWASARLRMAALALLALIALRAVAAGLAPVAEPPAPTPASAPIQEYNASASRMLTDGDSKR
ncbi:MAG: hypothetical protein LAT81_03930 [Oceanicaulis sp.]|nr:hypothetical protein [Oceanicaulis sp.]